MRVTFAHLCDYALVSSDGKVSILGIFSSISGADLPFTHPACYLAFEVELNHTEVNREFPIRLEINEPDGDVLFRADAQVQVQGSGRVGERRRFGQVVNINNVVFRQAGPHSVNIWLDGRPDTAVEFSVLVLKEVPAGPEA